jgi:predicted HTH transcriptional regulator
VRIEYKWDINHKKHIPKIVSSFANTHGGVFIIGGKTDEQNKVKFPIRGIPKKSGIEEQIQQSARRYLSRSCPEIILVDILILTM